MLSFLADRTRFSEGALLLFPALMSFLLLNMPPKLFPNSLPVPSTSPPTPATPPFTYGERRHLNHSLSSTCKMCLRPVLKVIELFLPFALVFTPGSEGEGIGKRVECSCNQLSILCFLIVGQVVRSVWKMGGSPFKVVNAIHNFQATAMQRHLHSARSLPDPSCARLELFLVSHLHCT